MEFRIIKILSFAIAVVTMASFCRVDLVFAAVPSIVECRQTDCTIDTGQGAYLLVIPKDDFGTLIVGTNVTYTWTTEVGVFASGPTASPQVSGVASNNGLTWTDTNSRGESRVFLTVPAGSISQETNRVVRVVANYSGGTRTATYSVSSNCVTDPKLYYGTATVEDGSYRHVATAEILETCRPEYRLKAITGERY